MFGPFEVSLAGKLVTAKAWGRRKTELLCKFLLSHRDQHFSVEQLIEVLYPGSQATGSMERNILGRISELRKALEPDLNQGARSAFVRRVGKGTYTFTSDGPCDIDVIRFGEHIDTAATYFRQEQWSAALHQLEQAIAYYRDDFLVEDLYEEWTHLTRDRLRATYLQALLQIVRCRLELQNYEQALADCERFLQAESYEDDAYRLKMLAQYRLGRRSAALQTYQTCVQALQEFGVLPSQAIQDLYEQIRKGKVAPAPAPIPHNLPTYATPCLGRRVELQEIHAALRNPVQRIITLLGPGGVGKTRMAIQAAHDSLEYYPQGVYMVNLPDETPPEVYATAIAEAINFRFHSPKDMFGQLVQYLGEKQMLILLDNAAHHAESVDTLHHLLQAPNVQFLVTARERLHLPGEWIIDVQGLDVPESTDYSKVSNYGAVRLFAERMRQVDSRFRLSETSAPDVVRICQMLGGLPLALELAAAWGRGLSCREIAAGIERDIDVLKASSPQLAAHHTSLRAVFNYSWQLLSTDEQWAFMRLCIFRGGFTREAAEQVAGTRLSTLISLRDKSVLRIDPSGRYHMHDILRHFGEETLRVDERAWMHACHAHANYYADFLANRETALRGPTQKQALADGIQELQNVRAAWSWAVNHDQFRVLDRALEGLSLVVRQRGFFQEATTLFETAAAAVASRGPAAIGHHAAHALQARLLIRGGLVWARLRQMERCRTDVEQGLELARRHCTIHEQAFALYVLGMSHYLSGNIPLADKFYQRSLQHFQEAEDPLGRADVQEHLGFLALRSGDTTEAQRLFQASLAARRTAGDYLAMANSLGNLGNVALTAGDHAEAKRLYGEARAIFEEMEIPWATCVAIGNLGRAVHAAGNLQEAAALYQAALDLQTEVVGAIAAATWLPRLAEVCMELGDDTRAWTHMTRCIRQSHPGGEPHVTMQALLVCAQLQYRMGRQARAAVTARYVAEHKGSRQETKQAAEQLLAVLEDELPAATFSQAVKDAQAHSLTTLIEEMVPARTA